MQKTAHNPSQTKESAPISSSKSDLYELNSKLSKIAIGTITCLTALIGIWSLVCLAVGLLGSGGLIELGTEWLYAVLGL